MMTVSGSFHGPKKLGPNDSYGPFIVEIWSKRGRKKIFWPKMVKSTFVFVFPNSTHEDGFRELSYDLLAQKKTWFVADLSNIFLLIMTWPCFDHKFPKIIFEKYFFSVYLNQARDDGFRELSWPQKAQLKLVLRQVFKQFCFSGTHILTINWP